jgi:geranylgeranyl pyrophosphate synthase
MRFASKITVRSFRVLAKLVLYTVFFFIWKLLAEANHSNILMDKYSTYIELIFIYSKIADDITDVSNSIFNNTRRYMSSLKSNVL